MNKKTFLYINSIVLLFTKTKNSKKFQHFFSILFLLSLNYQVIGGEVEFLENKKQTSTILNTQSMDLNGSNDFLNPILNAMQDQDVLVVGEEHDDKEAHLGTLRILKAVSEKYPISLSLEMLEWHQQQATNEYLGGQISESAYLNDSKYWNNFKEDYLPLVQWAKEKQIPVICANPSRRYANRIARLGLKGYEGIQNSRQELPLPQSVLRDRSPAYEEKLHKIFSSHGNHSAIDNTILAQHFWDAGMVEKIAETHLVSGRKILHLNGRFHSDFGLGVSYRLRKLGIRTLTLTFLPESTNSKVEENIADFLIFTKNPILKTNGN
jgi:uncharacterized iron-regulated protein